jgi:type II secretory pathway predicted ATPase ExeA
MTTTNYNTLYGITFNPFRPDIPHSALTVPPTVDAFCRRVEFSLADGGFALVTGDPGTGKSVALRILAQRLANQRDVVLGTVDHPQSGVLDFYRELSDVFGLDMALRNRWAGFKSLRAKWSEHIESTHLRPVLIIDECQEMPDAVFNELRILTSKDFDARCLLCVVFAGDRRLLERFRRPDLLPLATRIRRRLDMGHATREDLSECLDSVLEAAGNPGLMSTELKTTLAEHAAGNYRVMMNTADELLAAAAERNVDRLDEKLFFDVFPAPAERKARRRN